MTTYLITEAESAYLWELASKAGQYRNTLTRIAEYAGQELGSLNEGRVNLGHHSQLISELQVHKEAVVVFAAASRYALAAQTTEYRAELVNLAVTGKEQFFTPAA